MIVPFMCGFSTWARTDRSHLLESAILSPLSRPDTPVIRRLEVDMSSHPRHERCNWHSFSCMCLQSHGPIRYDGHTEQKFKAKPFRDN